MNEILEAYNKTNQFGRFLNMSYEVVKPGKITYTLPVTKDFLATSKAMHGGAIAAFMDAIVGVAAVSLSSLKGNVVSTVEFKINYLKPVFFGEILKGEGTVISEGNRIIICKGEIFNNKNELVAIATSTMNAYPFAKM